MKRALIILFLVSFYSGYSQSYIIDVELLGVQTTGCTPYLNQSYISVGGEHEQYSSGISSFPTNIYHQTITAPAPTLNVQITVACANDPIGGIFVCGTGYIQHNQPLNFPGNFACTPQYFVMGTTCSDGMNPESTVELSFQVTYTPIYSLIPSLQVDYCDNEEVVVEATPGYSYYIWEFSDAPGVWKSFAIPPTPADESQLSVTLNNLYGNGDNSSRYGTGIRFGVSISSCARDVTVQPIKFFPMALQVKEGLEGFSETDAACFEGLGSVEIHQLNRNLVAGEKITVSIFNRGSPVTGPLAFPLNSKTDIESLPVTFTNLPAGEYTFFVFSQTSQCGDPINPLTREFEITEPDKVTATPSFTLPSCHVDVSGPDNDGTITIDPGGGNGGYAYSLNGGAYLASSAFTGLVANAYTVRVKDIRECESDLVPVNLPQPSNISLSAIVTTTFGSYNLNCSGDNNAIIRVTASGGTGLLTYSKDESSYQGANEFMGLTAGSYPISVKDGKGCVRGDITLPVTQPPLINFTTTQTQPSCFGTPTGSINVSASGGTGSLTYSINGSGFTGASNFTGLSAATHSVRVKDAHECVVTQNVILTQPAAAVATATSINVICSGESTGTVTITAANGTSPYTYSFNGGSYSATNSFTGVAANSYTISIKDFNGCIGTGNVVVDSNPVITGTITQQTAISCNGSSDGAINLTPGGGVGPYTYLWSNGSVNEDITALAAGTYTVTIKDSKNCTKDFNRTLTEPTPISTSYFTSDYNGSNISCFGAANGSIDLSVTGGNGGYTYTWSSGPTSQDLTSLAAGTYTVTIKDSKNCPGNASVILTQPSQLIATLTSQQNVLCFGGSTGSISLNSLGGTGAYEYSINSGSSWQVAPSFTALAANNYTVLTRDINNCQATLNIAVTSPSDIVLSVSNIVNTTCNQNNGSALASATGGVASYTYEWFNSSNTSIGTAASINNLPADTYRVVITDQNVCTKQQSVPISSSNGPQITANTITPATCSDTADGSASINITGGSTPYTILWPNGQTTSTAISLAGGEYIVEVRDNTSCLALQTITVPAPDVLVISTLTKEDPNCTGNSDGMITLEATGGNGTYSYTWNTGATTPTLTNLAAGTYTITVKDFKNCTEEEQIILIDPPVFTIDLGADQKICEGMTVTLSSPETGAYTWTSDNGFTSTNENVQLTQAGTYTLIIINANGCEATDNFQLSYDADLLKADFLMTSEAHAGDTIVLIDISWPLPEEILWTYDVAATMIEETQDYSMIRFDNAGEYLISLFARLAQCSNHHEQSIIILEAEVEEETQGKGHEKLFEHISAYPNPSPDEVSVSIELSKSKTISLELYQAESNKRVYQEILSNEKTHVKALNLSTLPRGMYILYIRAGKESKTIKIIKQ